MGTRSITIVKDEGAEIAYIYNQWDGYPTGVGRIIKNAFDGKTLVNGWSDKIKHINGMGDLAVRLITVFKDGKNEAGGTYLLSSGQDDAWIEYTYTLEAINQEVHLTVESGDREWQGTLESFNPEALEAQWDQP